MLENDQFNTKRCNQQTLFEEIKIHTAIYVHLIT